MAAIWIGSSEVPNQKYKKKADIYTKMMIKYFTMCFSHVFICIKYSNVNKILFFGGKTEVKAILTESLKSNSLNAM